jgi:hypothetical protein
MKYTFTSKVFNIFIDNFTSIPNNNNSAAHDEELPSFLKGEEIDPPVLLR